MLGGFRIVDGQRLTVSSRSLSTMTGGVRDLVAPFEDDHAPCESAALPLRATSDSGSRLGMIVLKPTARETAGNRIIPTLSGPRRL